MAARLSFFLPGPSTTFSIRLASGHWRPRWHFFWHFATNLNPWWMCTRLYKARSRAFPNFRWTVLDIWISTSEKMNQLLQYFLPIYLNKKTVIFYSGNNPSPKCSVHYLQHYIRSLVRDAVLSKMISGLIAMSSLRCLIKKPGPHAYFLL